MTPGAAPSLPSQAPAHPSTSTAVTARPGGGAPGGGGGGAPGGSGWSIRVGETDIPGGDLQKLIDALNANKRAQAQGGGRVGSGVVSSLASVAGGGPGAALVAAKEAAGVIFSGADKMVDTVKAVPIIGPVAGAAMSALKTTSAAAATLGLIGLTFRAGVAQRRGELDTQMRMARLTGSSMKYGDAADAGYTPEEAAAAAVAYGQGAGFRGAGATPLGLARGAASIGAMAAYRGQMAAGAGGFGEATVSRGVGLAQASGLFGSRADEYLQAIVANTATMAAQGSKTNLPAVEDFLSRAAITPGLAGTGARQVAAMTTLTGAAAGARSQVAAPYAGLMQQMLMGYAYQRAGSQTEAMEVLGRIGGDPRQILKALRSMGMPAEELQATIMAQGMGQSEAFGLMSMNLTGETPGLRKARGGGASALKIAAAQREANLIGMVNKDDVAIFKAQQQTDKFLMDLGELGRDSVEKIINMLKEISAKL